MLGNLLKIYINTSITQFYTNTEIRHTHIIYMHIHSYIHYMIKKIKCIFKLIVLFREKQIKEKLFYYLKLYISEHNVVELVPWWITEVPWQLSNTAFLEIGSNLQPHNNVLQIKKPFIYWLTAMLTFTALNQYFFLADSPEMLTLFQKNHRPSYLGLHHHHNFLIIQRSIPHPSVNKGLSIQLKNSPVLLSLQHQCIHNR